MSPFRSSLFSVAFVDLFRPQQVPYTTMKICLLILVITIFTMAESLTRAENEVVCVCGRIYRPVCGGDDFASKTYDNECIFECERKSSKRLRKLHEGACQRDMDEMWLNSFQHGTWQNVDFLTFRLCWWLNKETWTLFPSTIRDELFFCCFF